MMFNNMKTGRRLAMSLGLVLALMFAVIGAGLFSLQRVQTELEMVVEVENARTQLANDMVDDARETAIAVRDFLLANYTKRSSEDIRTFEATLAEKRRNYNEAFTQYTGMVAKDDAKEADLIKTLEGYRTAAWRNQDHALGLVKAGDLMGGSNFMFGTAYPSVRRWVAALDGIVQHEDERTKLVVEASARRYQRTRSFMIALALAAGALSVAIVALLTASITRPLQLITGMIASRDLTGDVSAHENRRDEMGIMIRSFSGLIGMIRAQSQAIREGATTLASSSSEILAATTQVAAGTAETAASITETTTTVEEVRQAALLSSRKAQLVSDNAQRVVQVSQSGQKAVAEASAGMDRIRAQMETIALTVVRLSEQGQSIGGIIAAVTDLADQSNLLAVNAAIEAAKAGEQGKGFTVVAQEIKSLSEQSKEATGQVRGILNDVHKATSNAVMATELGSHAVEAGVQQAEQAGEAIRVLAETSGEGVQAAAQIVVSSQQQLVGMDQIGMAMENINQAGVQNAASMRQMEVSARDLHQLSQKLKELVEQFKV